MKQSLYNTFTAEKIDVRNEAGNERISQHVAIRKALNEPNTPLPGALVGFMFQDKTVNIILGNMTVAQVQELAGFLEWVDVNFWNI